MTDTNDKKNESKRVYEPPDIEQTAPFEEMRLACDFSPVEEACEGLELQS